PMTGGAGGGSGGGMMGGTGGGSGTMMPGPTLLLASGQQLDPDGAVTTSDGTHRLTYQQDGNLVLYRNSGGAGWSSGTPGTSAGRAIMQTDGNLVVYDRDGVPRFHTHTHGNPGAQLFFETPGRLHVIHPDGRRLWSGGAP
ncbi:MAG: hypothetical protein JNK82_06625, partial [Myxococcaceae bacterium]|nr:hypothetical protein [Myxococcaceae bacterium]